jgi:predicted NAD-dependent protein-ADP-ribosyltransferase YbiA (DUF1768 family)
MRDKLYFYSKSKDAKPGRGVNENVQDSSIYAPLEKIPHWRRVLSNFHDHPFVYEGYTYRTIEHAFQSKKIEIADPLKSYWFTVDSGHDIGLGDGLVARKHRKLVKLNPEQLKQWNAIQDRIMAEAANAKYEYSKLARKVLRGTNHAELWHIVPRGKPVRFVHLEVLRDELKKK